VITLLDGQVTRKKFGSGTKSEREAICVVTPKGDYLLRRSGANPFELDAELEPLVGKQVRFSGTLDGYTFFVSHWEVQEKS
jgi:hypothetical protein